MFSHACFYHFPVAVLITVKGIKPHQSQVAGEFSQIGINDECCSTQRFTAQANQRRYIQALLRIYRNPVAFLQLVIKTTDFR